jgi:hypothetical protein
MKESCNVCRYCVTARIKDEDPDSADRQIDNWCRMKSRIAPKNPCKWWRPKERMKEDSGENRPKERGRVRRKSHDRRLVL